MMTVVADKIIEDYEALVCEHNVVRRKLESKVQALLILSRELSECRKERDRFKGLVDQIHNRSCAIRMRSKSHSSTSAYLLNGLDLEEQPSFSDLLSGMKELNQNLQREVDDLRQKQSDAEGDIKLLREQIARQRVGSIDEGVSMRYFPAHEREDLVEKLESLKIKYTMLERDLQTVLDEKEELVSERDAYKHKVERLNHELNCVLKGDDKRIIDIDALVMENRYLQERLKQTQEEKSLYLQTLSKYKSMLEKKRNHNGLRLGANNGGGGVIITHKEVQTMLQNTSLSKLPTTQATIADLRSLALALFESLNDKNTALLHQKKANRILGNRVTELENKVKSLEIELWQNADKYSDRESSVIQRLRLSMSDSNDVQSDDGFSQSLSLDTATSEPTACNEEMRRDSMGNSSTMSCSTSGEVPPAGESCCSSPVFRNVLPDITDINVDILASGRCSSSPTGNKLSIHQISTNEDENDVNISGGEDADEEDEEDSPDLPPQLLKLVESALQDIEQERRSVVPTTR